MRAELSQAGNRPVGRLLRAGQPRLQGAGQRQPRWRSAKWGRRIIERAAAASACGGATTAAASTNIDQFRNELKSSIIQIT